MQPIKELEFVNRGEELEWLQRYLHRLDSKKPAAVIIRAPTGTGKSRLTDQLVLTACLTGAAVCVVDPEVYGKVGVGRVHEGFFVQRCAERLSMMAQETGAPWPGLMQFLELQRVNTAKGKRAGDLLAEAPSLRSAYKILYDYAARYFSFGDFSPEKLLKSDRTEAVRLCELYVEHVLTRHPVILILREVQHSDLRSLKTFVQWISQLPRLDVVFEYTSPDRRFEPHHEKLLYPLTSIAGSIWVLELVRLGQGHLEHLIRTNVRSNFQFEGQAYFDWDGNLRSLMELQFQVQIGHTFSDPRQIGTTLNDLGATLRDHIAKLTTLQRALLAICVANVEAVDSVLLSETASAITPSISPVLFSKALQELTESHRFLICRHGNYFVHNETVADAIREVPSMQALLALSEKTLRDHYTALVLSGRFESVGMASAVRQVFRLTARTRDVQGLQRATQTLSKEVELAQDPAMYVEWICNAIDENPASYGESKDLLLRWAGLLAYSVGSFAQAESLLARLQTTDAECLIVRACCLAESGQHEYGLQLAKDLQSTGSNRTMHLAGGLVEAMIHACCGRKEQARVILTRAIEDKANHASPLLGNAYRFFESVEDYAGCIDNLRLSIAWFDRFGLQRSMALSQAATAVLVARMGKSDEARSLIAASASILGNRSQARALLLNNLAAVELLSREPIAASCVDYLNEALRSARDDFSEVTILSNLSLAQWLAGHMQAALASVDKVLQILQAPDFADREVLWALYFNCAQIVRAYGNIVRADELLACPGISGAVPETNADYWAVRYGKSSMADPRHDYLLSRPCHPLYLSAWIIEPDVLSQLRPGLPQSPQDKSTLSQ